MRKLTVNRKKSFIESGSKIQLLVECAQDEATVSANGKYFKDFLLKNGKSVETQISNDCVSVVVLSSTMESEFTVSAGENDVTLLATPKFSPLQGNPFMITQVK